MVKSPRMPTTTPIDMPAMAPVIRPDDEEEWGSEISRRSRRIMEARSCWELLRDGFIPPEVTLTQSATSPFRLRTKHSQRLAARDAFEGDKTTDETPDAVGPQAWPLLEWILTVLEKDEQSTSCGHGACDMMRLRWT